MSEDSYCPQCGIVKDEDTSLDDDYVLICDKCAAQVIEEVPPHALVMQERIALLEKACEAAAEWFGPSLQDARFETVAVIKALREAGYDITKEHIL
jgi:hypothetical protein